jgi:hypothetical protein
MKLSDLHEGLLKRLTDAAIRRLVTETNEAETICIVESILDQWFGEYPSRVTITLQESE